MLNHPPPQETLEKAGSCNDKCTHIQTHTAWLIAAHRSVTACCHLSCAVGYVPYLMCCSSVDLWWYSAGTARSRFGEGFFFFFYRWRLLTVRMLLIVGLFNREPITNIQQRHFHCTPAHFSTSFHRECQHGISTGSALSLSTSVMRQGEIGI